jgi:hypothetical protein
MNRTLFSILVRWLSAAVLIVIGLWGLNLVLYHVWAADRFLSGSQQVSDWHQKWALIFFGISLIVFSGAGAIIWRLLFRRGASSETSQ